MKGVPGCKNWNCKFYAVTAFHGGVRSHISEAEGMQFGIKGAEERIIMLKISSRTYRLHGWFLVDQGQLLSW